MQRPLKEERLNAATHGLGLVMAIAATVWTAVRMSRLESADAVPAQVWVALFVYGLSLMGLYLMSTLSHVFRDEPWHSRFRQLDQGFIYLLIMGTYSPFAAVFIQSTVAWTVFGTAWLFAIYGCISKIFFNHRVEQVSVVLYVMLGWVPAMVVFPISDALMTSIFYQMAAGGVVYSLGIYFLWQDSRVWYFHGIWHLFVIGGSTIHFASIANLLLSDAG